MELERRERRKNVQKQNKKSSFDDVRTKRQHYGVRKKTKSCKRHSDEMNNRQILMDYSTTGYCVITYHLYSLVLIKGVIKS